MERSWSIRVGQVAGISIRLHMLFLLYIGAELLRALPDGGDAFWYTSTALFILFGSVLLHEFGHCFAARQVGGEAHEVLLWPLGGLAFVERPERPREAFLVSAGGPAVNLALALIAGSALFLTHTLPGWLPFGHASTYWLYTVYKINFWLLLFNLIPAFPLDGGSMMRAVLWSKMGWRRATLISITVGRVAAIGLGIWALSQRDLLLASVALYLYMRCEQERVQLQEREAELYGGGGEFESTTWNERDDVQSRRRRPGFLERLTRWRRRREGPPRELKEPEIRQRVDDLLDKISRAGMSSLTDQERAFLKEASEYFKQV